MDRVVGQKSPIVSTPGWWGDFIIWVLGFQEVILEKDPLTVLLYGWSNFYENVKPISDSQFNPDLLTFRQDGNSLPSRQQRAISFQFGSCSNFVKNGLGVRCSVGDGARSKSVPRPNLSEWTINIHFGDD